MNNPSTQRAGDHGAAVTVLQQRLARAGYPVAVDGWYGNATALAVRSYQVAQGLVADGIAGPRTQSALVGQRDPRDLTQADIERAAQAIDCDVAAIQAVIEVESPRGGYLADGRVVILFERHVFWERLLTWSIDPTTLNAPATILSKQRGGYVGGAGEYQRLALAKIYGAEPAMESCSWGRFQIMGYHAPVVGYESASAMAAAFDRGEGEQLDAFARFVLADDDMLKALRGRKWSAFARLYNGPDYADNLYDKRLARAYAWHRGAVPEAA